MKHLNLKMGGGKMSFTYLFYKHIMFRKSCGNCHFTNIKRPSDITIADFWGWENTDSAFNADNKGVSLVLLNTEKGRKLFDAVQDRMNTIPAELDKCLQPNMQHPSEMHPLSDNFFSDYSQKGFKYVMWKYGENYPPTFLRKKSKRLLDKIKRFIKKMKR